MKKLLFLFVFAALFASCEENDSDDACHTDCTRAQGSFTSLGGQPLANVKFDLAFKYLVSPGFHIRKVVSEKSNADGIFGKDFYVKDDELGQNGGYRLNVDDSSISDEVYIRIGETGYDEGAFSAFSNRDTILNFNFYIPKKAFIKVHLNNYVPVQAGDFFEVVTRFSAGYETSPGTFQQKSISRPTPNTQLNQFYTDVVVSEGAQNTIIIAKRKNGVSTYDEYPVFVPQGTNDIELSFDY